MAPAGLEDPERRDGRAAAQPIERHAHIALNVCGNAYEVALHGAAAVFLYFKEGHAFKDSARPQRKHAKPRQGRLPPGGEPAREAMTGQHAHMQAKRTTMAQGAGIRKRKHLIRRINAPKIPVDCLSARRGGSNVLARSMYDNLSHLGRPCTQTTGQRRNAST